MNNSALILPGHPEFLTTLHSSPPPGWRNCSTNTPIFVVSGDGSGMLRQIEETELATYIHGGEFDEIAEDGEEIIDVDI